MTLIVVQCRKHTSDYLKDFKSPVYATKYIPVVHTPPPSTLRMFKWWPSDSLCLLTAHFPFPSDWHLYFVIDRCIWLLGIPQTSRILQYSFLWLDHYLCLSELKVHPHWAMNQYYGPLGGKVVFLGVYITYSPFNGPPVGLAFWLLCVILLWIWEKKYRVRPCFQIFGVHTWGMLIRLFLRSWRTIIQFSPAAVQFDFIS